MRRMYQEDFDTRNQRGFTLVELAIVMTIIGLLIGGVLKGQEMIKNARITATISQVQGYQAALETFQDRYDQLPGDMSVARKRIPGCTDDNYCYNGDGNSIIGSTANNAVQVVQSGINTLPAVETSMFWKHLALSDLISGVMPSTNPGSVAWGRSHPSSRIRGGFIVATKTTGEPNSFPSGVVLKIISDPTRNLSSFALTGVEAAHLDRKMDDGLPNAGYVAGEHPGGYYGETIGCKTSDAVTGVYNETNTRIVCETYFRVR